MFRVIILIIIHFSLYQTCGVTTHNVIANRAIQFYMTELFPQYKDIILNNLGYFQNGAAFPDWGYNCFLGSLYPNLNAASEVAHWFPFQFEIVKYITANYQKPWNQEAQQVIAFLLGVVSHSISDIIWHDLGVVSKTGQGYIQAMANSNYNFQGKNYNSTIHSEADIGGEFLCAYEVDLNFIKLMWHLPAKILAQIYNNLNYTDITSIVIESCNTELYMEVEAVSKLSSEIILPYFAEKSPFLIDATQDWWLGGINDMAGWVSYCWSGIIDLLENNGTNVNYSRCMPSTLKVKTPYTKISKVINNLSHNHNYHDIFDTCTDVDTMTNKIEITSNIPHSLLGSSVCTGDFNNDGHIDIAIGIPGFDKQRGAVGIIYGNKSMNKKYGLDDLTLLKYDGLPNSRFGYQVISLDVNLDTYDDLVVAIPSHNSFPDLKYYGKIDIYFGSDQGININAKPNMTISSTAKYTNLGFSLDVGDFNGYGYLDLLVGIPFMNNNNFESGTVLILKSQPYKSGTNIAFDINSNDTNDNMIIIESDTFWSWFGFKNKVINYNNGTYLLIGQPMFNLGNGSVGALNCYEFNIRSNNKFKLKWKLIGSIINGQFGYSFNINGGNNILIGAPTTDFKDNPQIGVVYNISLDLLFNNTSNNTINIDDINKEILVGSQEFARYGSAITNDFISEPYYYFESGKIQNMNDMSCVSSERYGSLFGKYMVETDVYLMISLPRDSSIAENAGSVILIY